MKVTATQFRKNLFQIMDRVVNGELVEVLHKGNTILIPPPAGHKIARLIPRHTINGSPDELEQARRHLQDEMRVAMEEDWAGI